MAASLVGVGAFVAAVVEVEVGVESRSVNICTWGKSGVAPTTSVNMS